MHDIEKVRAEFKETMSWLRHEIDWAIKEAERCMENTFASAGYTQTSVPDTTNHQTENPPT